MRLQVAPDQPFRPDRVRQIVRGHVLVRLRPGVARDDIASHLEVLRGDAHAASCLDVSSADRVIRRFSPAMRVSGSFLPAKRDAWDDLEHDLGLSRTFRVEVDPDAGLLHLVDSLRALDAVESASPNYLCQAPFRLGGAAGPGDPGAFDQVGAAAALAREPGDPTVIVGVVDSGVALRHAELAHAVRPGADLVDLVGVRLSRGMTLQGDSQWRDNDASDDLGHGTGCASILVARGLHVPPGVAGVSPLLPLRALARAQKVDQPEPTAIGSGADIDAALKLGVDLGARVINLSFGTPETALADGDDIPHATAVRYALARGCVLVAASGNLGDDTAYYPAALPGVIAVGSVDALGRPSRFSCRGRHVALCAPGEHIPCAGLDDYASNTGTSFAAPFVAGAAALLIGAGRRRSIALTPREVRDLLVHSARPFGTGTHDLGSGAGILDIPAALGLLEEASRAPPEPARTRPSTPSLTSRTSDRLGAH